MSFPPRELLYEASGDAPVDISIGGMALRTRVLVVEGLVRNLLSTHELVQEGWLLTVSTQGATATKGSATMVFHYSPDGLLVAPTLLKPASLNIVDFSRLTRAGLFLLVSRNRARIQFNAALLKRRSTFLKQAIATKVNLPNSTVIGFVDGTHIEVCDVDKGVGRHHSMLFSGKHKTTGILFQGLGQASAQYRPIAPRIGLRRPTAVGHDDGRPIPAYAPGQVRSRSAEAKIAPSPGASPLVKMLNISI